MRERTVLHHYNNPYFPKTKPDDRWVYLTISALLLLGIIYFIFWAGYFDITDIKIEGNQNIKTEELKNIVDELMAKKKIFILPQNNLIILGPTKVEQVITEKVKNKFALENIFVEKDFPHTLKIIIKERIPGLIYINENGEGEHYYLDLKGFLVAEEKTLGLETTEFPKLYDLNQRQINLGEQVISENLMSFIINLSRAIKEKTSLEIESFSLPEIKCQEKQYLLEKVKLEGEQPVEEKEKKLEILEKYEKGEITGEEAMKMLETAAGNTNINSQEVFKIKEAFKDKPCDYRKILTQINAKIKTGYEVYFSSDSDLERQINNLNTVLQQKIPNPKQISYIDLRFSDRVYYK